MANQTLCAICRTPASTTPSNGDSLHQNCPRCGEFRVTGTAVRMLENQQSPEEIAKLSGWVRDRNSEDIIPKISSIDLKMIEGSKALSISQRSKNLLLEVVRRQQKLGDHFNVNEPHFIAASYSQDKQELSTLFNILREQGFVETVAIGGKTEVLSRGYAEAERLQEEGQWPYFELQSTNAPINPSNKKTSEKQLDANPEDLHPNEHTTDGERSSILDANENSASTELRDAPSTTAASEFFGGISIPVTQALRDLITVAAAYARQKKSHQNTISSTCLIFAAASGWETRIRDPKAAEVTALKVTSGMIRIRRREECDRLASEIFTRPNVINDSNVAGLDVNESGVVNFDSFDFSGMKLSTNLEKAIRKSHRVSDGTFGESEVSIAVLLVTLFNSPSATLKPRLTSVDIEPSLVASDIARAASSVDPNEQEMWNELASGVNPFQSERADQRHDIDDQNWGRHGALSDTIHDTEDKLKFGTRASSFAKLITDENLKLPLAIGLFGNWGVGKSFFMNLMKREVSNITRAARSLEVERSPYISRIAQIEFNAWHYVDANLWASMAARIFEGLMEELAGPQTPVSAEIRARLRTKIRSSKLQVEAAEAEQNLAKQQHADALKDLELAKQNKVKNELSLSSKLKKILDNDENKKETIKKLNEVANKFGFEGAAETAQDITDLIENCEKLGNGFTAVVARFGKFFSSGLNAAVFIATLAFVLIFVLNLNDLLVWFFEDVLKKPGVVTWVSDRVSAATAGSLATLGVAATWVGSVIKQASEGVAKAQKLRHSINDIMELVPDGTDPLAEEKSDLEKAEAAIVAAEQEVRKSELRLGEVAKELQRINSGGLVYDFLAEKLNASEYTKNLGLISTIREDLRDLGQLIDDWRRSTAIMELDNGDNVHAISRIVLYIDDLDRCHPDRVVEVLQAVHLLLAYDLFVVVVAVDARWLEQSLYRKYAPELFVTENLNEGSPMPGVANEFSPHNYLEKIFQIPFSIPKMTPEDFGELMSHLAGEIKDPSVDAAQVANEPSSKDGAEEEDDSSARKDTKRIESEATVPTPTPSIAPVNQEPQPQPVAEKVAPVPALLGDEAECLGCMCAFIKTPRLAKRLVNLYRLIRISSMEKGETLQNFMDEDEKPFAAVLLMLAINIAYPEIGPALFNAIHKRTRGETLYSSDFSDSWHFSEIVEELNLYASHGDDVDTVSESDHIGPLLEVCDKGQLGDFISDLNRTVTHLERANCDVMSVKILVFRKWTSEIEQFSFNS